jgi:predicted nicotinamide N-methyase
MSVIDSSSSRQEETVLEDIASRWPSPRAGRSTHEPRARGAPRGYASLDVSAAPPAQPGVPTGPPDPHAALRASLREQLVGLRGVAPAELPPALLDLAVHRFELPGGAAYLVRPADWEELRHQEGSAGCPVPYWATAWPSGLALAAALAADPPAPGTRVLELGCGLALPSLVCARAGARVLATDGSTDAVAFAAHSLALNEVDAEVAHVDWERQGDALAARGPWDLVLAADVLYTRANVETALRLLPRLLAPEGEVRLADPRRAGGRDFLAAARATFTVRTRTEVDVALHRLTRRRRPPS